MSDETTTALWILIGVIAFFAVPMGLLMHVYVLERVHIFTGWRWPVLSAMADRRSRVVGATPERLRKTDRIRFLTLRALELPSSARVLS